MVADTFRRGRWALGGAPEIEVWNTFRDVCRAAFRKRRAGVVGRRRKNFRKIKISSGREAAFTSLKGVGGGRVGQEQQVS